jgi:hypothetical protein
MDFGLLDALRKLAFVLVCPLFIAAYLNDNQMLNEHYQLDREAIIEFTESSTLNWMLNSEDIQLRSIGWGGFIGFFVIGVGCVLVMTVFLITESDRWVRVPISTVFGIGCMLLRVLFIAGLASGAPFAKLNPFWNLALVCYGFILFDRGG